MVTSGILRAENAGPDTLLPPPRVAFKPWYERVFNFTRCPDGAKVPAVVEIPNLEYQPGIVLDEVLRGEFLAQGWEDRIMRVPEWIPQGANVTPCKLDAYVLRQATAAGILHICDTRPFLVIAFLSQTPGRDFRQTPRPSMDELSAMLLRIALPGNFVIYEGDNTGLVTGRGTCNVVSRGRSATGVNPEDARRSAFGLNLYLGENLIVYEFQKFHVPNCNLDPAIPLFRLASVRPTDMERAVERLEALSQPSAQAIPEIVRILQSLPRLDATQQTPRPYDYRLLSRAKYAGYDKLAAAVQAINPSQEGAVALVKTTLEALPVERGLRSRRTDLQRLAVETLKEIGTPAAHAFLREMARTTDNARVAEDALEVFLKANLKGQSDEVVYEFCVREMKGQGLAEDPDKYPVETEMLLRAFPKTEEALALVRGIQGKTKNAGIREQCVRLLGTGAGGKAGEQPENKPTEAPRPVEGK